MLKDTPVFWKNELVGHIEDPYLEQFYESGRWKPIGGPMVAEFEAAVREGLKAREQMGEGVYVRTDVGEAEVTDLEDGTMDLLYRSTDGEPERPQSRRWWRFWR